MKSEKNVKLILIFVDGFINNETSMSLTRAFVFCFSAFSLSFLLFEMLMNKLEDKSIREPKEEHEFTPLHVLPHSIIIGVKKCGTRALITMLEDIFQDVKILVKEPWFFSHYANYERGIEYYKNMLPLMTSPKDIIMEKSPPYFFEPKAAKRIHEHIPYVKLILIVCDPVRRSMSDFLQEKSIGNISESMTYRNHLTGPDGYNANTSVVQNSLYGKHIKPWLKIFPWESLLILDGQELIENPGEVVKQVEEYLNLPKTINGQTFFKNPRSRFYCWRGRTGQKCLTDTWKRKGRPHPKTDPQVVKWLREYLKPSIEEFYQLTNLDFNWKMDKL